MLRKRFNRIVALLLVVVLKKSERKPRFTHNRIRGYKRKTL